MLSPVSNRVPILTSQPDACEMFPYDLCSFKAVPRAFEFAIVNANETAMTAKMLFTVAIFYNYYAVSLMQRQHDYP